jgi:hypothetical protein
MGYPFSFHGLQVLYVFFIRYHGAKIRKLKVLVDGVLVDNPTSRYWRETGEFHLKPGLLQDYHTRKSSAALCLSGIQKRFSNGISDWARKWALPHDLCHRVGKKSGESEDSSNLEGSDEEDESPGNGNTSHSHDCAMDSNNKNNEEKDTTTTMSSKRNYFKVVNEKSKIRTEMEETAANGQKKQAVEVNKYRKWEGGETIPKGTVCLLKLSQDKNSVGVKELPVVITSLHYYKQSGNIRYRVASKDGHITGTYGREELRPLQQITAKLIGIDIASLGKGTNAALTPLQAQSRYLPIGEKNKKCRCKTNCSKSSTCSCRKAGKLCTKHCHKNNTICTWCDTQQ